MIAGVGRIAAAAALLCVLALPARGQQSPRIEPAPLKPLGGSDPARGGALAVDPPAALSRAELTRRLRALDPSLPKTFPAGASVIVTPGRLDYGRTHLGLHGAVLVALNNHGAAVAVYSQSNAAGGFQVTFDAAGPSRYAIDVVVAGTQGRVVVGTFAVSVYGFGHSRVESVAGPPDGHLLHLFDVPRAGRYTIRIDRETGGIGGWIFYRLELLRVR
jgi:hypothetical protein